MAETSIIPQLDINVLTKTQYANATKAENAIYMVIDDVTPIEDGGTGAITAQEARDNLGVTDVIQNIRVGGRNYISYGKGDYRKGFFSRFDKVADGYGEVTLTSQGNYSTLNLDSGFLLGCRDYEVGRKIVFSYDIMYTSWNFPEGADITEFWFGQRYSVDPNNSAAEGRWTNVTAHNLPIVGENGCELNKWYHVERHMVIPERASDGVGTQSSIQFYNSNSSVSVNITLRMKNVKIEYGSKATDFSLALEDIEDRLENHSHSGVSCGHELTESWQSLQTRINAGDFSGIHIGDWKEITLTTGAKVVMEVAGIDQYYRCCDTEVGHHIDFISRDCLLEQTKFNNGTTNNGIASENTPWRGSHVYAYLNNTVYNNLPADLKPYIIQKRGMMELRYSASGNISSPTGWTWIDMGYLWLPTEIEVYGFAHWSKAGDGTGGGGVNLQYPIFFGNARHLIKGTGKDGQRGNWWLSSVHGNDPAAVICVSAYGTCGGASPNELFYTPICFRIG